MIGKAIAIFLGLVALVGGAAMYWLQVYAFYDEVPSPVIALVPAGAAAPRPIAATDARAIDADSSPLRYRACFDTSLSPDDLGRTYEPYPDPVPLTAPGWFDCYDAGGIAGSLEDGSARAFLGDKNVAYGVDRVVAITRDGQGFVWHQLNDCDETAYDGTQIGEDCPPREEFE